MKWETSSNILFQYTEIDKIVGFWSVLVIPQHIESSAMPSVKKEAF